MRLPGRPRRPAPAARGIGPGSWPHLLARFLDVLASPALQPDEAGWVRSRLRPVEAALFFAQGRADRRHGYRAGRWVAERSGDRPDLVRAALLHDVGKRHARLGVAGRVAASLLALLGRRPGGRMGTYLAHGPLAAAELADLGAEPVVVEYARHHHGDRPTRFDPEDWRLLDEADRARLGR